MSIIWNALIKIWNAIVGFLSPKAKPTVSTVSTQEPKLNPITLALSFLRNPKDVVLPEGWKPGWKLSAQGTAIVQTPDGHLHEGDVQLINPDCFVLESPLGRLEKGLNPAFPYDQWAFRTGSGTGPGGAMLVMVARVPGSRKLLFGTIDEKRPLSTFVKNDGSSEVLVMRTPPGGFVDPKEDADKTAQRETLEECGIETSGNKFVCSLNENRAFFVTRFYEDGRPADSAVAVYTVKVDGKKLIAQPDGSYVFPQPAVIPDSLKKAKTLQVVFRSKKDSCNTADGLAIAAISKTEDFYSK
jgi:ADP-ribose pyrophosphatase YjhB (NUDIX family)